ncbi:MAG: cytochrome c3 family protein [Thermodesulfobacteriota bacterium]
MRTILISMGALLFLLAPPLPASARIAGVCSDCHTIHNSQDGMDMRLDLTPITGAGEGACLDCHSRTRASLLRMDCLGCHAQDPTGSANIVAGMPQVAHNAAADLAGGNYRNVFFDDRRGHNVHGFGNALIGPDSFIGNTPPGYNTDFDPASGKYQTSTFTFQLMCSGQNGCHGNREEVSQTRAMKGTHHADDSALKYGPAFNESGQGSTPGVSYRFLYRVHGAEDSDWQATSSATDHNEYKGATGNRSGQVWADIASMSQFCAECHGNFHSSAGIGSPGTWLRHPTDVALSGDINGGLTGAYNPVTPVGRQSIAAASAQGGGTFTPGSSDVVMCLSCHRAHGSPYQDLLRWDLASPVAGTGCLLCHDDTAP